MMQKDNFDASHNSISLLAVFLLAALFLLCPLLPQHVYSGFEFFFRSSLFLIIGIIGYSLGGSQLITTLRTAPLTAPLVVLFSFICLSYFYSPDVYRAKDKTMLVCCIWLIYGIALIMPLSERARSGLIWTLAIGGSLAALHGLCVQWLGHETSIESLKTSQFFPDNMRIEMIRSLEANRAMGRFGNPNHFAGYLVLSLWPLWALWKHTQHKGIHCILTVMGAAMIWGIYGSFSRSGLIVLATAIILIAGYELHSRGFSFKWKYMVRTIIVALALITLVISFIPSGFFGGRLMTISTIVARMHFFRGAIMSFSGHPWLGVGVEGYEAAYSSVLRPGDLEAHYVHNFVLEAAAEGGVVGLLIVLWLVLTPLWFLYRKANQQQGTKNKIEIESLAALGAFFSLLLLSLVDFHNNLMGMWVIPAFLLGLSHRRKNPLKETKHSTWSITSFAIALAIIWILLGVCRFWNENSRLNGHYLLVGDKKLAARTAYENAVLFDRTDAESWRRLGLLWRGIPNPIAQARSLEYIELAIHWAPRRASIRADYAESLFALGYTVRALDEILTAQRLFPARPDYYLRAAELYHRLQRDEAAEKQMQKAKEIQEQIKARQI